MVEPLLHFVVPFVSLRAVGLDFRKATFASFIALTPDLDVLFEVHRSPTHSALLLGIILLAFLAFTWKRKRARPLVLLAAFGLFTHLLLDVFSAPTPLLWPLLNESFSVWPNPNLHMWNLVLIWYPASWLGETPVLTAEGLAISITLLAPIIGQIVWRRIADSKSGGAKFDAKPTALKS